MTQPPAPDHLTTEQREIWKRIIASLPSGFIKPSQLGLLANYCLLEDMSRRVNVASAHARREFRQNTHEMVSIARALRLTNKSITQAASRGGHDVPG
jgi:hypothetical protein